jgi:RNA polymerase sigma-70 factor, ECF subfamily
VQISIPIILKTTMSQDDPTSSSLLRRAVACEPDAWERLVTLYSPLVIHWCRQSRVPEHDVPDVSQEIFAAISSNLYSFRAEQPGTMFRAWIRGIARHKLLHCFRERGTPGVGGTDALKQLQGLPDPIDAPELSEGPEQLADVYRRALALVQDEFGARTWTAFWRVVVEDHSPADVSADMGITPSAVRQAKSRVLRRLREEMGELIV